MSLYEKIFKEKAMAAKLESEKIDISLPSKKTKRGSLHPMTRIQSEFEDIFVSMGYTVYDGPELESDENCFQKLNVPKGHPARDAQDTFYLKDEYENNVIYSFDTPIPYTDDFSIIDIAPNFLFNKTSVDAAGKETNQTFSKYSNCFR